MTTIKLFHGSSDKSLVAVKQGGGLFGGIFMSASESSAAGHGDFLYTATINQDQIASSADLAEFDGLREMFKWLSDEQFDEYSEMITDIVINDCDAWDYAETDVTSAFAEDDIGSAAWYAQKLRGEIAAKLGFVAVEMDDEHGTSYLVLRADLSAE